MVDSSRLSLAEVTICAVDTRLPALAYEAIKRSQAFIDFGAALLFTNANWQPPDDMAHSIQVVRIPDITSTEQYSTFMLKELLPYIQTDYVLIVQWDGYVIHPEKWLAEFLSYDYIGAIWPQFKDAHQVGNGGFSLRSKKLLQALSDPSYPSGHPEDLVICRTYRESLEKNSGIRFAPGAIAEIFSVERQGALANTFGFHGLTNLFRTLPSHDLARVFHALPKNAFKSIEARGAIKELINRNELDLATQALEARTHDVKFNINNFRLNIRLALAKLTNTTSRGN